jgi:hypothetical protein
MSRLHALMIELIVASVPASLRLSGFGTLPHSQKDFVPGQTLSNERVAVTRNADLCRG